MGILARKIAFQFLSCSFFVSLSEEKGMDLKEVAEEVLERCCTEELICKKTV